PAIDTNVVTMPPPVPVSSLPQPTTSVTETPAIDTNVVTMPPPVPVSSLPQPTTSVTETPAIDTNIVPTMPPTPSVASAPTNRVETPANAQTTVTQNAESRAQIDLLQKQNEKMDETNRLLKEMVKPQQPAPIPPPNPASINLQQTLRSQ
ncbi:MAG: hypothetical protein ACK5S6_03925, partial [bacterium]